MPYAKLEGTTCQSCGMLIEKKELYGTEKGGKPNLDYCTFCYQEGRFIEPDITAEQMLEKMANILSHKLHVPAGLFKSRGLKLIMQLKRWKKKE